MRLMKSFNTLKLHKDMLANIEKLGYTEMMPIQAEALPVVLDHKDLLAQAKTGSGKTAAFAIGILERLKVKNFRVQALVLCPTRELAEQVAAEFRKLGRFRHNIKTLCITGGKPQRVQEQSLRHEAHIVVGTPGRLMRLLKRGALNLDNLYTLVLDEADRMLDMGFLESVEEIISYVPEKAQKLCFSATFSPEIRDLARKMLKDPVEVQVESLHTPQDIEQHFYQSKGDKGKEVALLLNQFPSSASLIFCNTKQEVKDLSRDLNRLGFSSLPLQGDMEQKDRTETLIRFSNGSSPVLVATDVAARGLDISDLPLVINADIPFEAEQYIHRIGRTGRAGQKGLALSLCGSRQQGRMEDIAVYQERQIELEDLPAMDMDSLSPAKPEWVTISINGGRKSKISAGDILGALTAEGGIPGDHVGKIDRLEDLSYIALRSESAEKGQKLLQANALKGRQLRVFLHRN